MSNRYGMEVHATQTQDLRGIEKMDARWCAFDALFFSFQKYVHDLNAIIFIYNTSVLNKEMCWTENRLRSDRRP